MGVLLWGLGARRKLPCGPWDHRERVLENNSRGGGAGSCVVGSLVCLSAVSGGVSRRRSDARTTHTHTHTRARAQSSLQGELMGIASASRIYDMRMGVCVCVLQGELMGIASASRIYDIPAHSITEVHGVELHDPENMLNKVCRVNVM